MKDRRLAKADRRKTMRDIFADHSEQDRIAFGKIDKTLGEIVQHIAETKVHMAKSSAFMEELTWISNISKGTKLLQKPSIWILAFILGIVALMGGLKAMIIGLMAWVTPR